MEAVEREASFPIPAFATESPSGASEAQDGQPEHPPRGDMGVDVEAEIAKLRAEDPAITLPLALKRLYAKFPAIFVPVESPNEPLPIPETGVWRAAMIGATTTDTREPKYA